MTSAIKTAATTGEVREPEQQELSAGRTEACVRGTYHQ
jgi:hypothetical protein